MENQTSNKEWLHSLLTGQWWRDYVTRQGVADEELPSILSALSRPQYREGWLKYLLPLDPSSGLLSKLWSGTVEFSVPMSAENTVALRNWVDMNVASRSNSVFLDTTCLETVRLLIEDRNQSLQYFLPLTLLDLSTFVSSAILNDRIYHLQNPYLNSQQIKTLFEEEFFYELPVQDVSTDRDLEPFFGSKGISIEESLDYIFTMARQWAYLLKGRKPSGWSGWLGNKIADTQVESLSEGWKTILGQEPTLKDLLGDPNQELLSWRSPTQQFIEDLRQADKFSKDSIKYFGEPGSHLFKRLVSESNHRAMFNHILAQSVLELPYAPSSARWPFRRFLYSISKEWPDVLLDPNVAASPSVRILEEHYREKEILRLGESDALQLPIFLAAILNRVDNLSQIPEEIAHWRKAATRFRQRGRELDEILNDGTRRPSEINRIMKALKDEATDPRGWVWVRGIAIPLGGSLAIIAPTFFQAHPLAGTLVSLVLTLPALFDPIALEKLHRRLFRREYYFLTQIGDAIDELTSTNILEKIKSLWNLKGDDFDQLPRRLQELKSLRLA